MVNPLTVGRAVAQQTGRVAEDVLPRAGTAVVGRGTTAGVTDLAAQADTLLQGGRVVATPGRAIGPGAAIEAGANPLAWRNQTWDMGEVVDAMSREFPAAARGVPRDPAGLRSMFDDAGWDQVVRFFNGNPDATVANGFIERLARDRANMVGSLARGATEVPRMTLAQVETAIGAGNASVASGQAIRGLGDISRLRGSHEIPQLQQQLNRMSFSAEQATQLGQLQRTIGALAEEYPGLARAVAQHATHELQRNPNALAGIVSRAEAMVTATANRTRTLNPGTSVDEQLRLGSSFMGARTPADATSIFAPTAVAPAAAVVEGAVPESLRRLVPNADRLATFNEPVREALSAAGGFQRIEAIARQNPDLARALVSELGRGNSPESTLRAAEWLARRGTPDMLNRVGMGFWTNEALPESVTAAIRAGSTPAQALSTLDQLITRGMSREYQQAIWDGLRRAAANLPQGQRTQYLEAVNAWWARARVN